MPRAGLSRQTLVGAAAAQIEEEGYHNFSMQGLAKRLHVRPSSLYNHVESLYALQLEVGYYAIAQLNQALLSAAEGRTRDEAVRALAFAYYGFAKEHLELYRVLLALPGLKNDALLHAAGDTVEPIMSILSQYDLNADQKMHLQRVLRSLIHGFIAQEDVGCFTHFPVAVAESFELAVRCFLEGLWAMEGGST